MNESKQTVFNLSLSKKQRNFPAYPESSAATVCIDHKSLRICDRCRLAFQVRKIPLNFHGGGAALAGGGDRLPIKWICHVSGGEHSGQARLGASPLNQVAVGIHFDFSLKRAGVGLMADGDENAFHLQIRQCAGFDILEFDGFYFALLIGYVASHYRVPDRSGLAMTQGPVDHDFSRPQCIAPMDKKYLGSKAGEKDCFFRSSVAAA